MAVGEKVTNLVIELILIAILVPVALGLIFSANMTGWDSTTQTIFKLIGMLAVIGLAVGVIYQTVSHKK